MTQENTENRLVEIESILADQERMIKDLNDIVTMQAKTIDVLFDQVKYLVKSSDLNRIVRSLSEETPPPHY